MDSALGEGDRRSEASLSVGEGAFRVGGGDRSAVSIAIAQSIQQFEVVLFDVVFGGKFHNAEGLITFLSFPGISDLYLAP